MIEKNRNILSDAISRMPVRKPKASGWSGVSGGLDQIDAGVFISNNASKLPKYEAPANAWNKIAAGLPSSQAPFFTTLFGRLLAGTLIIGGIIISYFLFTVSEGSNETILSDKASLPVKIEEISAPQQQKNEELSATAPLQSVKDKPDVITPENVEIENIVPEAEIISTVAPPPPVIISPTPPLETNDIKILTPIEAGLLESDGPRKSLQEAEVITPMKPEDTDYVKDMTRAEFKAGVFYAFKRYQNIEEEGMDIPQNQSSFGLELSYKKGKWFFKTALAYVGWEEKGDYTFDYNQNQLVYQYDYVDSTYINPNNGFVNYFTTENFVYDSVSGQQQDQASYKYQMLQIPLMVCYSLFERRNFSIGVLGGVGFDIRLSGKQFVPAFNQDESTVKDVNNSLKYRTSNNWRLIGGLELGYIFASRWELYAEPSYQYYMKPLYSPDNTTGVGLLNIKFGLRYIF